MDEDEPMYLKKVDGPRQVTLPDGSILSRADLPPAALRPGVSVTAKIVCGRSSLGYAWFHDVIAFVQSRLLFRYFW